MSYLFSQDFILYISKKFDVNLERVKDIFDQYSLKCDIISIDYFGSNKEIEEYTRDKITKLGLCSSIKSEDISFYYFLKDLFLRHPRYMEKEVDKAIDFIIVQNGLNKNAYEINFILNNGRIESISWIKCAKETKQNPMVGFKMACRTSVDDQIYIYRSKANKVCSICSSRKELEVDHVIHFEKLLSDFLLSNKMKLPSSFDKDKYHRECFKPKDKKFGDIWKEYHKKHAILRILCKNCNLTREKYKK